MEQIERIAYMETLLDEGLSALQTGEVHEDTEARLAELFDYYFGPLWRQDLADDEAGLLPEGLKRSVLSEDAVYDLFTALRQLKSPADSTEEKL